MNRRLAFPIFLVLIAAPAALADVVTLAPTKDNTLCEDDAGTLSNGVGDLFAGRTAGRNPPAVNRRALLAFDVAGAVPAGATINSVTLELTLSKTTNGVQPMALHRLLADWGEGTSDSADQGRCAAATNGDATWVHRFFPGVGANDLWTTKGGDFQPAPSATVDVDQRARYTWGSTPELVADIRAWLDDPASSFGWILIGNEVDDHTTKRFDSRNSLTAAPRLTVDFTLGGAQPDLYESASPVNIATAPNRVGPAGTSPFDYVYDPVARPERLLFYQIGLGNPPLIRVVKVPPGRLGTIRFIF